MSTTITGPDETPCSLVGIRPISTGAGIIRLCGIIRSPKFAWGKKRGIIKKGELM